MFMYMGACACTLCILLTIYNYTCSSDAYLIVREGVCASIFTPIIIRSSVCSSPPAQGPILVSSSPVLSLLSL